MTHDDTEDFASMLAEFERETGPQKRLKVGDTVTGPIVSIGSDSVFVQLGAKAEGILDREQVTDPDGKLEVEVGDVIEAIVVSASGGGITLRRTAARTARSAELEQAFAHGLPVEGVVAGTNKGGFEIQVGNARGFCPISQMDLRFVDQPEEYVGQRYEFVITKLEPGRGGRLDLVLSRRALLAEEQKQAAAETRANLREGLVMSGTVISLKPYGAFVDVGGLEGMIHISEMGHARVAKPEDVLSVGQKVEVVVLRIEQTGDPKRPEKIALSLKALEADPWNTVAERYPEGSKVHGRVVRLAQFGAFVELEPGIEGLVHISELGAGRRVNHPREVVREGQEVDARVVSVDPTRRRLGLSLAAGESAEPAWQPPPEISGGNSLGTFGDLLAAAKDSKKKG